MPNVKKPSKLSKVTKKKAVKATRKPAAKANRPVLITKTLVSALLAAQNAKLAAEKAAYKADLAFKTQMISLFDTLFGIKTLDEIKKIDPATLEVMFVKGFGTEFAMQRGADFEFVLTRAARYVAWKDELIKVTSEAFANKITAATPEQYSYRVRKS